MAREPDSTQLCLAVTAASGAIWGFARDSALGGKSLGIFLVLGLVVSFLGLIRDAGLLWLIARFPLRRPISFGEILRPVAITYAPSVLKLAALQPQLAVAALYTAELWMFASLCVAISSALGVRWSVALLVAISLAAVHLTLNLWLAA